MTPTPALDPSLTVPADTWFAVDWATFMQLAALPDYAPGKFYYHQQQARIEMPPVGYNHSSDHSLLGHAVHLYAGLNRIPLNGHDNLSYRQPGHREAQPDLSFYIGESVVAIPYGTTIVNLDELPPPTLVVEVANTSLADDLGQKRLLYEQLGVQEYWVVEVQQLQVFAFAIALAAAVKLTPHKCYPACPWRLWSHCCNAPAPPRIAR